MSRTLAGARGAGTAGALFRATHHACVAPPLSPSNTLGRRPGPKRCNGAHGSGVECFDVFLATGLHLDRQPWPLIGHQGALVAMGRAAGFTGVVARDRAIPIAVPRRYRGADVQDPGFAEPAVGAVVELFA